MTIQRQYSLPNCTLLLEGWGSDLPSVPGITTTRPVLSILTTATCSFTGQEQALTGGREFFEEIIATVSHYAQEFLSGVSHVDLRDRQQKPVEIKAISPNLHRLTVRPQVFQDDPVKKTNVVPIEMDLTTVHLFDLVEAIDQFYADTQTLPDLSLNLTPAPKRNVTAAQPVTQRALPAALGISGLAVAAIALFFIPVPDVRPPQPSSSTTEEVAPTTEPTAAADDSFSSPPPDEQAIDTLLSTAPAITDAATLAALSTQLEDQLSQAWVQERSFDEDLLYRVGVAESGDILGFKYSNDAALEYVDETPLLDLRYNPIDPEASPAAEPIGQFQVVFTPEGEVEVTPWESDLTEAPETEPEEPDAIAASSPTEDSEASPESPETETSPETPELGEEITDSTQLESLNGELYSLLQDNLPNDPEFGEDWNQDLIYKVHFTPDGEIVAVEPQDQDAETHLDAIGFADLMEQDAASDSEQGEFMVVITDDGVLQVSPWDGYR